MAAVSSSLNPHMQVVKEVYLIKCMFMYVHVLFVFLSLLPAGGQLLGDRTGGVQSSFFSHFFVFCFFLGLKPGTLMP